MELTSLRCPSCGAEVVFSGEVIGKCPYCDSQLHFDDVYDKVELERLRRESYEQSIRDSGEENYRKQLRTWKLIAAAGMAALAALNIAGFLIVTFGDVDIGAPLILLACAVFLFFPLIMGVSCPFYDEETGSIIGGGTKKAKKTLALYGISLAVAVVSIFSAGFIAEEMVYESDSDKQSSRIAENGSAYSDECDVFVNEWLDCAFTGEDEDLERYVSSQCPSKVWESDRDSQDTYILIERLRAQLAAGLEGNTVKVTDVTRLNELSDEELLGAEAHFMDIYDADVTVLQGYEYNATVRVTSKETSESRDKELFLCAVKLKGDGWKIINENTSYLRQYTVTEQD